jgi:hypothetical protein
VLDVGNAAIDGESAIGPLHDAAPVIAITVALAAVIGVGLALLDDRVRVPRQVVRGTAIGAAALIVLAGAVGAAAYGGRVRAYVSDAWTTGAAPSTQQSRLLSLAPEERPDYARVSIDMFQADPVTGAGIGNFGREYDARRDLPKHSRYAHDLWLRAMGELGIVGIALLLGILGALATGAVLRRRGQGPLERSLVGACFGVGAYFLAHGSLDWLEEFPALAMPAVALPFAALAMGAPRRPAPGRLSPGGIVAVSLAFGAILGSLVPAWLAVRYYDRAQSVKLTNPAAAFVDYDRAADMNPLAVEPLIAEGGLALGLGQTARAKSAFNRSLEREPNWAAYLNLALMEAREWHWGTADRLISQAAKLDSNDPVIAEAQRQIAKRRRVDPNAVLAKSLDQPLFRQGRLP